MELLFKLVDIAIVLFGCYAMYAGYLLNSKNIVTRQILLSKEVEFKKCRDIEGYKKYMVPKIFLDSAIIIVLGGANVVDDFYPFLGVIGSYLFFPLLFAILWFAIFASKGQKTYYE